MRRIILIDDDPMTHNMLRFILKNEAQLISMYSIQEAMNGRIAEFKPDLILIDRILPDGDGITICGHFRNDPHLQSVPLVILSGRSEETDKVAGLYAGADDYIAKPFSPLELKARIEARLRKSSPITSIGQLLIELENHRVFFDQNGHRTELELTRIEFKILSFFAKSPDRVYSREQLLENIWGHGVALSDRVVDAHISHLRKKILGSGVTIEALRGSGYRLHVLSSSVQAA